MHRRLGFSARIKEKCVDQQTICDNIQKITNLANVCRGFHLYDNEFHLSMTNILKMY